MNGSGRAPKEIDIGSIEVVDNKFKNPYEANTVTVPGSMAGWLDSLEKYGSGKVSLEEIFEATIGYAESGFPVSDVTAHFWAGGVGRLHNNKDGREKDLLVYDEASASYLPPRAGQLFRNKNLGQVRPFRIFARTGAGQISISRRIR